MKTDEREWDLDDETLNKQDGLTRVALTAQSPTCCGCITDLSEQLDRDELEALEALVAAHK